VAILDESYKGVSILKLRYSIYIKWHNIKITFDSSDLRGKDISRSVHLINNSSIYDLDRCPLGEINISERKDSSWRGQCRNLKTKSHFDFQECFFDILEKVGNELKRIK